MKMINFVNYIFFIIALSICTNSSAMKSQGLFGAKGKKVVLVARKILVKNEERKNNSLRRFKSEEREIIEKKKKKSKFFEQVGLYKNKKKFSSYETYGALLSARLTNSEKKEKNKFYEYVTQKTKIENTINDSPIAIQTASRKARWNLTCVKK